MDFGFNVLSRFISVSVQSGGNYGVVGNFDVVPTQPNRAQFILFQADGSFGAVTDRPFSVVVH